MRNGLGYAGMAIALASTSVCAASTHFGFKQIIVAGDSNVQAHVLNNRSEIAGIYTDGMGSHGFTLAGSTLTVLPTAYPCTPADPPIPTSINARGDVVGGVGCGEYFGFLWRNGAYVQSATIHLGYNGPTIGINNKGYIFYEYYGFDDDNAGFVGYLGAFSPVMPYGFYPVVTSVNNHGVVAGSVFGPNGQVSEAVFTDSQGVYTDFVPPGALASSNGFVNDAGYVAGLYETKKDANRGFVYEAGQYRTFVIPGEPRKITVQAFNNHGRVVGVYTDTVRNIQRIFFFNGSALSVFGRFSPDDQVHVGLNDEGAMLVSDTAQSMSTTWRVLCGGPGC